MKQCDFKYVYGVYSYPNTYGCLDSLTAFLKFTECVCCEFYAFSHLHVYIIIICSYLTLG